MKDSRVIKYRDFEIYIDPMFRKHWVFYHKDDGGETSYSDDDLVYIIQRIDDYYIHGEL